MAKKAKPTKKPSNDQKFGTVGVKHKPICPPKGKR